MKKYPSKEDLEKIRHWDFSRHTSLEFAIFICEVWNKTYGTAELYGKRIKTLKLWTGGWSGNEDIIKAIMESDFWLLYWQVSTREGIYIFEFIDEEVKK